MTESLADHEYAQALMRAEAPDVAPLERVEMLVEIAMGMQKRPRSPSQLEKAVALYDQALSSCPPEEALLAARIRARRATALFSIPDSGAVYLEQARAELEVALLTLARGGSPEENAEAELNLGLVLQSLSGLGRARIVDAIAAYQRSVRVFRKERYPAEFAILHNNLATAYLSMPMSDERASMREALAVQSFTEALKVVSLVDNPSEYAMLQNNLGNALQYAQSGHPVQNNLRALEAYDAALQVRNERDTPVEYANTISNKANCLRNLPDDVENPAAGNLSRLLESRELYRRAAGIFRRLGELERAGAVEQAVSEIQEELGQAQLRATEGTEFGEPRV